MMSVVFGSWSAKGSGGRSGIRFLLASAQVRTALTTASWPCLTVSSTWSSSPVIMSVAVAMGGSPCNSCDVLVCVVAKNTTHLLGMSSTRDGDFPWRFPLEISYPKTYLPGASPTGGWAALPMGGASRLAPALSAIQAVQSSHQEPLCSVASESHACGSRTVFGLVQWIALGLGGLTIPAMCPEDERVNRTLPGRSWVVLYAAFQGAMWSSFADST